jgi:hypothetical protein
MQISTGKLVVLLIAVGLAFGGVGAVLADDGQTDGGQPIQLVADDDARKNDADGAAVDDDDDNDDDDDDGTNATSGTGVGNPSQAAVLLQGKTAAQWMGSARLYKQRWLKTKRANQRHAQQVRNLRASQRSQPRVQTRYSSSPRAARGGGGGTSGGGTGGGSGGGDT